MKKIFLIQFHRMEKMPITQFQFLEKMIIMCFLYDFFILWNCMEPYIKHLFHKMELNYRHFCQQRKLCFDRIHPKLSPFRQNFNSGPNLMENTSFRTKTKLKFKCEFYKNHSLISSLAAADPSSLIWLTVP